MGGIMKKALIVLSALAVIAAGLALAGALFAAVVWSLLPTLSSAAQSPVPRGDASCSGTVNSIDASMVLMFTGGLLAAVPCPERADVDSDGSVTSVDATLILQIEAGIWTAVAPTPVSPEERGELAPHLGMIDLPNSAGIAVSFTLLNNNLWELERRYATGQRYDVVVRDELGEYVWNWFHDTPFTQALETRVWEPGEWVANHATWRFEDKEGSRVEAGTYDLTAFDVGCTVDPTRQCDLGQTIAIDIPPAPDCNDQDGLVTDLIVNGDRETFSSGENVSLTLVLFNCGDTSRTRGYSSGQMYDFVVHDEAGQVIWHWSHGFVFTQLLTDRTFEPGEMFVHRTIWQQDTDDRPLLFPDLFKEGDLVAPGIYELFGFDVSTCRYQDLSSCDLIGSETIEILP